MEFSYAIATTVGIAGVIGSLIFSGYQTRQLTLQTVIQNEMAKVEIIHRGADRLSETYRVFVDYPDLRKYFYDGVPCPSRGKNRARVLTVAEMICDTVDSVLETISRVASREERTDWLHYIEHILDQSPTIGLLVLEHPREWPEMAALPAPRTKLRRRPSRKPLSWLG